MDRPEGEDQSTSRYLYAYSPDDTGNPTVVITEIIRRITGTSTDQLEPLSNVINPDALNCLVRYRPLRRNPMQATSDAAEKDLHVDFVYEGYKITVTRETVCVEPSASSQLVDPSP